MRLCDHNFPNPNPNDQSIGECMSVECGTLFVIDKMPCGTVRVRWCDIVLMAHVLGESKTDNKMSFYMNIFNGYLVSF
jgi:hypothetical protein